jgi:phosphohistidine swiveling domain-containing protein
MTAVTPLSGETRSGSRYICALDVARETDIVGGKASALHRVMRAGLGVPDGFAITTFALEDHLERSGLRERIAALCDRIDYRDATGLEFIANSIRSLMLESHLSPSFRDELFANSDVLLACGLVVVRSSGVGEDSREESFAGQLDSILHVASLTRLEQALLECWASFWSARALFYRAARGVRPLGMGVVVQQQVDARSAGVLFTAAGDEQMLVEYTNGLADALVSGAVDPNRIAIDRRSRSVRGHSVVGGTNRLSDRAITQLFDCAIVLERAFDAPQDVEWALDRNGLVWIVQSRPITAPIVGSKQKPTGGRRISWSNANVNENFPAPISPFLYSIAAPGYTHYFRNLAIAFGISRERIRAMEPSFRQIIGVHGARMYYNLTSIHSVLRLAPFGKALSKSFDTFVGADGSDVELVSLDNRGKAWQLLEVARIALETAQQFRFLSRRIARFEATVDRFAERARPERLSEMSGVQLRDVLRGFVDIRCNQWLDASLADAASMICYGALERLLKNAYRDKMGAEHTALLKAIPDVVSGEPVRRLWSLSRLVRQNRSLEQLFETEDSATILSAVRSDPKFANFSEGLNSYLNDWGFRCSEELMLTSPSFQEDPTPLIDMIRSYARLDAGSPDDAVREQQASRVAETRRVLRKVSWRGIALRVLLPWTHAAIRFRERARMKQALLYSRCRRIALAVGDHLVGRGMLTSRDDVFFFTMQELDDLLSGSSMLPELTRATVTLRRNAHAKAAALGVPDAFTLGEGEYFEADDVRESLPDVDVHAHELRGTSACAGRVTGRATVLRDVTQAGRLQQGDILVTRQTDPGWGPVFFLISGLVIERGGMLSHGAIIAREFGIPCVVGVRDAMNRIEDGTCITVDADAGVVHACA